MGNAKDPHPLTELLKCKEVIRSIQYRNVGRVNIFKIDLENILYALFDIFILRATNSTNLQFT